MKRYIKILNILFHLNKCMNGPIKTCHVLEIDYVDNVVIPQKPGDW